MKEYTIPHLDCPACGGLGVLDIGDCENGVWNDCENCLGAGIIEDD